MILLNTFITLNLIAFVLMGNDTKRAQFNKRRVSEKTILGLVFLGGTIGSGFGMLFFRHKISKKSYLLKFWSIVFLQLLIVGFYLMVNI